MANVTPTPYRTSDLKTKISSLAQTSVYQLKMQPPSRVSSLLRESDRALDYNRFGENIELLCESAVLPGSGTATHDVTNDYAGVSEKMVYRRMYDGSIELSFMVDHDYNVIEFFEGWIDYITGVGKNQSRNMYKSRYANYRMTYPNDYRSEIYLTKFEKDVPYANSKSAAFVEPKQLQYTFVGAFPESVASTPVSYEGSSVLEVNVTMSYIRYVRERKVVPVATTAANFNTINNIFNFF